GLFAQSWRRGLDYSLFPSNCWLCLKTTRRDCYERRGRFVSMRLAATLLADGAPCFAICACPALVIKRDCSYISIHFSLEIAEVNLPIASSGKSSGDSK